MILGSGVNVIVTNPDPPVVTVQTPTDQIHIIVPTSGPQGPPGPAGVRFTFTQLIPAATWTIVHNLNAYPDFLFFISGSPTFPVATDVDYPDANTAVVTWPSPESGRAES